MKISEKHNSLTCTNFSSAYPELHTHVFKNGQKLPSRYGDVSEVLGFKTVITNPRQRCVGGDNRDINVFFLLAEALWIFKGKRDVAFLEIFNSRMREFSDDGIHFHAPYGWRIRNYNLSSEFIYEDSNKHIKDTGIDQMREVIKMLEKDPYDRRAVISIWDPNLDLAVVSKDIPCNDLLMFKIRNNKLRTTIANRSNDLNWGLTTNVFQFSFIGELIALILGIELGDQTHMSDSLHVYMTDQTKSFQSNIENVLLDPPTFDLYRNFPEFPMDFKFSNSSSGRRLYELDDAINFMINSLKKRKDFGLTVYEPEATEKLLQLSEKSLYLYTVYMILELYVDYKNKIYTKQQCIHHILTRNFPAYDIVALALNFFLARIKKGMPEVDWDQYRVDFMKNYENVSNFSPKQLGLISRAVL